MAMKMASPLILKTPAQGAATQCYLATSPAITKVTGACYADCNPSETTPIARDMSLAARLWRFRSARRAHLELSGAGGSREGGRLRRLALFAGGAGPF